MLKFENNRFLGGDPTLPLSRDEKTGHVTLFEDLDDGLTANFSMDFSEDGTSKMKFEITIYELSYYRKGNKFLILENSSGKYELPVEEDLMIFEGNEGYIVYSADIDSKILRGICDSSSMDVTIKTETERIIGYNTYDLPTLAKIFYRGVIDQNKYHDEKTEKAIAYIKRKNAEEKKRQENATAIPANSKNFIDDEKKYKITVTILAFAWLPFIILGTILLCDMSYGAAILCGIVVVVDLIILIVVACIKAYKDYGMEGVLDILSKVSKSSGKSIKK